MLIRLSLATLAAAAIVVGCSSAPAEESTGASTENLSVSSICYRHVLPASRSLCFEAFESGASYGASEDEITASVKACGFVDWPSTIQSCLRDLVASYGGSTTTVDGEEHR